MKANGMSIELSVASYYKFNVMGYTVMSKCNVERSQCHPKSTINIRPSRLWDDL